MFLQNSNKMEASKDVTKRASLNLRWASALTSEGGEARLGSGSGVGLSQVGVGGGVVGVLVPALPPPSHPERLLQPPSTPHPEKYMPGEGG